MCRLTTRAPTLTLQVNGSSCQGDKARRTQVRDPAGEEEHRPRLGGVGRVHESVRKEVARVIERHDDHDESAEHIHGSNTPTQRGGNWFGRGATGSKFTRDRHGGTSLNELALRLRVEPPGAGEILHDVA